MKIVEVTDAEEAAAWCGKLFRWAGGEVVKVESNGRTTPERSLDISTSTTWGRSVTTVCPSTSTEGDYTTWRAAPMLGEHNADILSEVLGMTADTIERLLTENVLSDRPPAARPASVSRPR